MDKQLILDELRIMIKRIESYAESATDGYTRHSCYPQENAYCDGIDRGAEIGIDLITDMIDLIETDDLEG